MDETIDNFKRMKKLNKECLKMTNSLGLTTNFIKIIKKTYMDSQITNSKRNKSLCFIQN